MTSRESRLRALLVRYLALPSAGVDHSSQQLRMDVMVELDEQYRPSIVDRVREKLRKAGLR